MTRISFLSARCLAVVMASSAILTLLISVAAGQTPTPTPTPTDSPTPTPPPDPTQVNFYDPTNGTTDPVGSVRYVETMWQYRLGAGTR